MRKVIGNIIKANKIFNLIENNDRICIGVSGGKDSMTLLYALSIYRDIAKKEGINFSIIGVHLKMNICAVDYDAIKLFWNNLGIEFYVEETIIGEVLKKHLNKGKIQCSLCSKMKKAILIDVAKNNNCNKVAMGHHADDAIETLFLNLINEGRIATFKPKMYLDRSDITFIRPLISCREKDIIKESSILNMPILPCGCPMEGYTQRDTVKQFLEKSFYSDSKWKNAYKNFYISLFNGKQADLWFIDDDKKIIDVDMRKLGIKYDKRNNHE